MNERSGLLGKLFFGAVALTSAGSVSARIVNNMPEPSAFSLIGVGLVAGIVVYRITRKK